MMSPEAIEPAEQPPVSPRWLPAALFAALVIAGLLGMHTFSAPHSDVHVAAASPAVPAMDPAHMRGASGTMNADAAAVRLDHGGNGSHPAMMMACVLGLLGTLLLACRAKPSLLDGRGPTIVASSDRAPGVVLPRPPSLLALSISRT